MEGDLAALRAGPQSFAVVEVAHHRLGAELAHARRRPLRARERAHVPALGPEALDESASDEAGSAGDERRWATQRSSRGPVQKASPTVTVRAISAWWRSECGSPSS